MKWFLIALAWTIGMVYSASVETNTQCNICSSTMDWARSNDNMLSIMMSDGQVNPEFITIMESDVSAQNVCGLLGMCDPSVEAQDYLMNLRGGGHGGHGGQGGHGHGHVGHNGIGDHSGHGLHQGNPHKVHIHDPHIDLCPFSKC